MQTFYSHGKLLLTAEYVVLDGAKALAVPTVFGQHLSVETITEPKIIWTSFDQNKTVWFEDTFLLKEIISSYIPRNDISNRLIQILKATKQLNPEFLINNEGFKVTTNLEFPKNWGLGTSSTLINNIAQWANVNPYELLELTFGGSGYDIACAQNNTAIIYQLKNNLPKVELIGFNPIFSNQLYFVHLNKKQNSREGIAHYKSNRHHTEEPIKDLNKLTETFVSCTSIEQFMTLINKHETIISNVTNQSTVKERFFKDFEGSIKSLGAWGGDFVLVASKQDPTNYFKIKGFNTILNYGDMVL